METNIHEYLKKLVELGAFPGASYALIYRDQVEMGSIGYKSLYPDKQLNRMDSLYDIASLSKVIVTLTILTKYLENKKIYLDDLVTKYLPEFPHNNITIYDLMTHTSGMAADLDWRDLDNREELIEAVFTEPIQYERGTNVVYSDLGYLTLGLILEKISGKTLDVLAKQEIFLPLGMYDTTFNPENKEQCAPTELSETRGLICGTVHDEKASLMGGVCGSAGVFSSIRDMIRFTQMILNDGKLNGHQFLKKDSLALWKENLVTSKEGVKRSFCFLIGPSKVAGNLCSLNTISFTGFTGPTLVIDRDRSLAFILLTNRIHPTRENKLLIEERGQIMDQINKVLVLKK